MAPPTSPVGPSPFDGLRAVRRVQDALWSLVEQFASAALDVADHVYVMERGRVAVSGTPDELRRDPRLLAAYLG